ncbi:MAG: hypothetical protein RLZZ602_1335 [Pseudomonadota bacterium]|jgi:CRISPR/Cas system-associated exonuclease Cas4 (RecB family)
MDLIKAIDLGTKAHEQRERRCYIGASNVGNPCHRYLQYSLRGYPQTPFPPAVLRIFELGHTLENMVVEDLKKAGINVSEVAEDGKQWEYTWLGGHVRGHADGVIRSDSGDHIAILEIKSMNDKKWNAFRTQGIRNSHPIYYAQMQLLMGLSGIHRAWMVAYNKNNSVYHHEEVGFDYHYFRALSHTALSVVRGSSAKRISDNPQSFECRYCNYKPNCWPDGQAPLAVNVECQTCRHAKPTGKRQWLCTLHGSRATGPCKDWYKL